LYYDSGFQYYKLTQYIKYKAALAGITAHTVASSLAKECYSMKLDLFTNATVVDDAIRFVSESEKSKDKDKEEQVKSSSSSSSSDSSSNEDENKESKETSP
jgi:hypothetical protein